MISKELAKKVRYLQIRTSKTVNEVMAGEYKSAFRGSGMEFDEVREYQPGDEVRSIDWNVTARQGRPFVKRFHEERELTVLFAVDLSASGLLGTRSQSKNELAAELCALLSFAAIKSNDKAGLLLFTDRRELFLPPAKGTTHALRLIREVLGFSPEGKGTDIASALDYLGKIQRKRAVIFLISDFQDSGYEHQLRLLSRRHEVIAIRVTDPAERELPDLGLLELEDAETGERALVDTSSHQAQKAFRNLQELQDRKLLEMFRSLDIGFLDLSTGKDYQRELITFLRKI
ncbi:MAG: DUF58 domain-containing protein [Victivallales bacterium]|jgi:uncharacterized protein (DUF58 family)|nr:DUF58 domain-containing protein [Victivallales bacterium]